MISHPRETLFVHIPKTGGQSVETVFLKDLGLGWQDRTALLLRHNKDRTAGPEKLAHLYADEYVALGHIPADRFASYLKFTIVRHPYDRAISEYRYRAAAQARRGADGKRIGFDDFLRGDFADDYRDVSRHMVPQVRFVQDARGRCLVDHVLRFESLGRDIAPLFARIFGQARPLPHKNRSTGVPAMASDSLTPGQKEALQDWYRADFKAFGYAP